MNRIMGHAGAILRALRAHLRVPSPRIAELGAGDGTLLLRVARRARWQGGADIVLVDRQPVVSADTAQRYRAIDCRVSVDAADVFDWLSRESKRFDAIVANLFLHHFDDVQLSRLLRAIARQTRCFIACEPRRSRAGLAGVSLMPFIRVSEVTRHDGRISVLAGFRNGEISAFWPRDGAWAITERSVAPFTHLFVART
jgi:2-polyprenyl-3-methyl-5-hydroxy-6-metoxy-1,4-benzoquinol methylase